MAAPVVYQDVAEGFDSKSSGTLFAGKKFWVAQRVPARNQLLNDIIANGGEIERLEKKADYLIADHVRGNGPPGSVSYEFVEKSIKYGELQDPKDHPAGPPLGEAREPGALRQPTRSGRTAYTAEEDRILYKWIREAEARGVQVSGNDIYKQLEQKYPRHTWQSWRDRYLKQLRHRPPSVFMKPDNAPPSPPSDQPNERMPPAPPSSKPVEKRISKQGQTMTAANTSANNVTTEYDYSVDELEVLFSTDDWLELYAFTDLIDSPDAKERYDSAWEEWADYQGNQTAEQWRQYFEKVVRPQWLQDPESKRLKIKRQMEKKHDEEEIDSQSQSIGQILSQTSRPVADVLDPQFDDERFEDLITDKSNKGIPVGYKFYAREKKQQTLNAQPGRRFTALHVYLLNQWHSLSKQEQAPYIAMTKKIAAATSDQAKRAGQTASVPKEVSSPEAQLESPNFLAESQGNSVKRLRESDETEEQEEETEVSRLTKRRKSGSATPTTDDPSRTTNGNLGTQQHPLEISSTEDSQEMIQPDIVPQQTKLDISDFVEDDETTMVELDGQSAEKEMESIESDVFPETDQPPQPPPGYEPFSEDDLPSNTPTPRATRQKISDFDTQAILSSPTQDKVPRSFDLTQEAKYQQESLFSSPQVPGSDASTAQSIEEFRRSLQEERLAQPASSQYHPLPLALASSPARSTASSASNSSGDPDPPLSADEITDFYDEQNAQGFSNDFISAALKRTGLRPELTIKVLDTWAQGKPLPNERGIWSKEDDAAVESGDGFELAKLGRKHTVDGWGGVTERLVFLESYRSR